MKKYFEYNKISYDFLVRIYSIIYGLSVAFVMVYDEFRVNHGGQKVYVYLVLSLSFFSMFSVYYLMTLFRSNLCKESESYLGNETPLNRGSSVVFFEIGGSAVLASFLSFAFFGIRNIDMFFEGNNFSLSAFYMLWNLGAGGFLLFIALWFASEERSDFKSVIERAIPRNSDKFIEELDDVRSQINPPIASLKNILLKVCERGILISVSICLICLVLMLGISTAWTFGVRLMSPFEAMVTVLTFFQLLAVCFSGVSKSL